MLLEVAFGDRVDLEGHVATDGLAGVGSGGVEPEERLHDLAQAGAEVGELAHEVGHGAPFLAGTAGSRRAHRRASVGVHCTAPAGARGGAPRAAL